MVLGWGSRVLGAAEWIEEVQTLQYLPQHCAGLREGSRVCGGAIVSRAQAQCL